MLKRPWPGMLRGIWGDPKRYREQYWSNYPKTYFAGDGAHRDKDGYTYRNSHRDAYRESDKYAHSNGNGHCNSDGTRPRHLHTYHHADAHEYTATLHSGAGRSTGRMRPFRAGLAEA